MVVLEGISAASVSLKSAFFLPRFFSSAALETKALTIGLSVAAIARKTPSRHSGEKASIEVAVSAASSAGLQEEADALSVFGEELETARRLMKRGA